MMRSACAGCLRSFGGEGRVSGRTGNRTLFRSLASCSADLLVGSCDEDAAVFSTGDFSVAWHVPRLVDGGQRDVQDGTRRRGRRRGDLGWAARAPDLPNPR